MCVQSWSFMLRVTNSTTVLLYLTIKIRWCQSHLLCETNYRSMNTTYSITLPDVCLILWARKKKMNGWIPDASMELPPWWPIAGRHGSGCDVKVVLCVRQSIEVWIQVLCVRQTIEVWMQYSITLPDVCLILWARKKKMNDWIPQWSFLLGDTLLIGMGQVVMSKSSFVWDKL